MRAPPRVSSHRLGAVFGNRSVSAKTRDSTRSNQSGGALAIQQRTSNHTQFATRRVRTPARHPRNVLELHGQRYARAPALFISWGTGTFQGYV